MTKSKSRKRNAHPVTWGVPADQLTPRITQPPTRADLGICLHGLYIFDPNTGASEGLRQFLWAGLRVLGTEAKARGLSEGEVNGIVTAAFDMFHDTADVLWASLQKMTTKPSSSATSTLPPDEPVGDEEYPVASFYKPAAYEWTAEGYEVRKALKRFNEDTHADR